MLKPHPIIFPNQDDLSGSVYVPGPAGAIMLEELDVFHPPNLLTSLLFSPWDWCDDSREVLAQISLALKQCSELWWDRVAEGTREAMKYNSDIQSLYFCILCNNLQPLCFHYLNWFLVLSRWILDLFKMYFITWIMTRMLLSMLVSLLCDAVLPTKVYLHYSFVGNTEKVS